MVSKKRTKEQMLAESIAQRHGRGFKRTRKQWENSIADHIGKAIDRLQLKDISNLVPITIAAIAGYKAVPDEVMVEKEREPGSGGVGSIVKTPLEPRLAAAGFGVLSYKLATSPNPIAGAAGVVGLAGIGAMHIVQADLTPAESDYQASVDWLKRWLEIWGLAPKT